MVDPRLIKYLPADIERIAQQTLRQRIDVPLDLPVNIERLLQGHPNVEIQYEMELGKKYGVEAAVCKQFMGRTITVLVDWSLLLKPARVHYAALAEEYAHILLHSSLIENVIHGPDDFADLQMDPTWEIYERDAKRLSVAMRMPSGIVAEKTAALYPSVVDQIGFGDFRLVFDDLVVRLARSFDVEIAEMRERIHSPSCNLEQPIIEAIALRRDSLTGILEPEVARNAPR